MLGLMCLTQGHNAVTSVRLKPTAPRSQVKHSTTEPLHFPSVDVIKPSVDLRMSTIVDEIVSGKKTRLVLCFEEN